MLTNRMFKLLFKSDFFFFLNVLANISESHLTKAPCLKLAVHRVHRVFLNHNKLT